MKKMSFAAIWFAIFFNSQNALALGFMNGVIAEIDPIGPASSVYDESQNKNLSSSNWGGRVDFNLGSVSSGPEIWSGTYNVRGQDAGANGLRRENLWPGERQKLSGTRLRWNITRWEVPESMRGWSLS